MTLTPEAVPVQVALNHDKRANEIQVIINNESRKLRLSLFINYAGYICFRPNTKRLLLLLLLLKEHGFFVSLVTVSGKLFGFGSLNKAVPR